MNEGGTDLRTLLVVEDDAGLQAQLKWAYEDYRVLVAGDHDSAIELLRAEEPDVVTLDLGLPPDPDGTREGFRTLKAILEAKPDTKVIVVSGHDERASALTAIASGAWDFYQKPIDIDELGLIVRRAFHVRELEVENARLANQGAGDNRVLGGMITGAPEMQKVARTIERVANLDVSVMLLGASGTGKELLARGLHEASARRDGAFVAINCAAIPENLLESELFGHEKGAFTGAVKTTEGKIELAHGGTLFLDEVGDIPLPLQVKLLRFLQERTIERIGGRKAIAVDTRIVCATHRDLDAMIAAQSFRDDLYYRLAEMVVKIPSLAERPGDAVLLARHFLHQYAPEMNPGVRPNHLEATAEFPPQRLDQHAAALRVRRACPPQMPREVTLDDEVRQDGLVQRGWTDVHRVAHRHEPADQVARDDHIADSQRGKQHLAERADVDDAPVAVETL